MPDVIYLASPYTHASEAVREARFEAVCRAAGELMRLGYVVFSPIAHTHAIAKFCELPKDWEFWKRQDEALLRRCTTVIVLKLEGWDRSVGVAAEVAFARECGLSVAWLDPQEVGGLPTADDPLAQGLFH